jgi:uncharacterized cofD-like protein
VTGNFEQAIKESSRVLAVRGQILPSTLDNVTLCAETDDAERVEGESNIGAIGKGIRRIYLQPENPPAYPEAVAALLDADLIVLGPGSLYTSIMPNLLVEGISNAVRASRALKVYVCNVATQPGETDGFSLNDHVAAIEQHAGEGLFQYVLANERDDARFPSEWHVAPIVAEAPRTSSSSRYIYADVVNDHNRLRHDPAKLSAALMRLLDEKRRNQPGSQSRDREFSEVAVG